MGPSANIQSSVPREKLLDTLRQNYEKHRGVVKEACQGYLTKASEALRDRLSRLGTGECCNLCFDLSPPADHSESYRTAIAMLEWSVDPLVPLGPADFRRFVQDRWDWTDHFLTSNSGYSASASGMAMELGLV